jgi:hypothetical protein
VGAAASGLLIYRHMLPVPSFRQAIQRVGEPGNEKQALGAFYPRGRYLEDAGAFEMRGCARR